MKGGTAIDGKCHARVNNKASRDDKRNARRRDNKSKIY